MKLLLSLYETSVRPDFEMDVALDPEVGAEISEILGRAEQLPAVKDDQSLAVCIETGKEVKALVNGLEESREALKKPFLHACRAIDDAARKARAKLGEVYADLMSAAAIYESAQKQKREAEKAKHEAELERLARQAHQEKDEQKRNKLIQQAQDAALAANALNQSSKGMALIKAYRFEIENLDEIWKFNRKLLKIELSQSACMDMVRMLRDSGAKGIEIPGIRVIEENKARITGAR
jgi:hypothetical protein